MTSKLKRRKIAKAKRRQKINEKKINVARIKNRAIAKAKAKAGIN